MNRDPVFIELGEIRKVMGGINPKLSIYKKLLEREKELLKKLDEDESKK